MNKKAKSQQARKKPKKSVNVIDKNKNIQDQKTILGNK